MKEKLIIDYLKDNKLNTLDDFCIENIQTAGEWVMFGERGKGDASYYCESHMIPLFDIVAWAYVRNTT